jgi:hypothetical protein
MRFKHTRYTINNEESPDVGGVGGGEVAAPVEPAAPAQAAPQYDSAAIMSLVQDSLKPYEQKFSTIDKLASLFNPEADKPADPYQTIDYNNALPAIQDLRNQLPNYQQEVEALRQQVEDAKAIAGKYQTEQIVNQLENYFEERHVEKGTVLKAAEFIVKQDPQAQQFFDRYGYYDNNTLIRAANTIKDQLLDSLSDPNRIAEIQKQLARKQALATNSMPSSNTQSVGGNTPQLDGFQDGYSEYL